MSALVVNGDRVVAPELLAWNEDRSHSNILLWLKETQTYLSGCGVMDTQIVMAAFKPKEHKLPVFNREGVLDDMHECLGGDVPVWVTTDGVGKLSEAATKQLEKAFEQWVSKKDTREKAKMTVWHAIMLRVSRSSINELERKASFMEYRDKFDVVHLVADLIEIHKISYFASNSVDRNLVTEKAINEVVQHPYETIIEYFEKMVFLRENALLEATYAITEDKFKHLFLKGLNSLMKVWQLQKLQDGAEGKLVNVPMDTLLSWAIEHEKLAIASGARIPSNKTVYQVLTGTQTGVGSTGGSETWKEKLIKYKDMVCNKAGCGKIGHGSFMHCGGCGIFFEGYHNTRKCKSENKAVTNLTSIVIGTNTKVILDTAAQISIIDRNLLSCVKPCEKINVIGVAGNTQVTCCGLLMDLIQCYATEDGVVNILSFAQVEEQFRVEYVPNVQFVVYAGELAIIFKKINGLYVSDLLDWNVKDKTVLVTTVAQEEARFTKLEVEKAKLANKFLMSAGYPSLPEAIRMLNGESTSGFPFVADDLRRAVSLYGNAVQLKGTDTKHKVGRSIERIGTDFKQEVNRFYSDIMYMDGCEFLVSVAYPLGLTLANLITKKDSMSVGYTLREQLNVMYSKNFKIDRIFLDPMGAFTVMVDQFPGIVVDAGSAGAHNPEVDERIRRIKDMARSIIASLPYKLPKQWMAHLVTYVVGRLNLREGNKGYNARDSLELLSTGRNYDTQKSLQLVLDNYWRLLILKIMGIGWILHERSLV